MVQDMGVEESQKGSKGRVKQVNWEEFGELMANSVLGAVDYWCMNISGDDALTCFSAHADLSLYDLASEFVGSSYSGITKRDLYLLRKMPENIYEKYDNYVRGEIERIVNKLAEEYKQLYRGTCEKECGSDEECVENCIEEQLYDLGP
jgi:hypothetical protein